MLCQPPPPPAMPGSGSLAALCTAAEGVSNFSSPELRAGSFPGEL